MRPDEAMGPKFLLYHDVVAAAGGDAERAAASFSRHFAAIAALGYRFVKMSDFLGGARLGPRDAVVTVDDGSRSFVTCMLPTLRAHGAPATLFLLSGLAGRSGTRASFLSWDEARTLAAEGDVEFGGHGVGHVPLDQVDPESMLREIAEGTTTMRAEGLEPLAFAYPFGRYDDATKLAVREAGYRAAFSVMKGGGDAFEIRRRLFTGLEGPLLTRFIMSDRFFDIREAARRPLPRRMLRQELPVSADRWGAQHFGVTE
jgi:peptidoglycan/xylan/chitin deacetylase (PgdA/CDA1 family)